VADDELRVRLEEAQDLLRRRHRLALPHAADGLRDCALDAWQELVEPHAEALATRGVTSLTLRDLLATPAQGAPAVRPTGARPSRAAAERPAPATSSLPALTLPSAQIAVSHERPSTRADHASHDVPHHQQQHVHRHPLHVHVEPTWPVRAVGMARVYLSPRDRRRNAGWWARAFGRPLSTDIVLAANRFGLPHAIVLQAQFGYTGSG